MSAKYGSVDGVGENPDNNIQLMLQTSSIRTNTSWSVYSAKQNMRWSTKQKQKHMLEKNLENQMVQTTWSNTTHLTAFYDGLAPRLKDKLAGRELPDTLEGWSADELSLEASLSHPACKSRHNFSFHKVPSFLLARPPPTLDAHSTRAGEPIQIGRASLNATEREQCQVRPGE